MKSDQGPISGKGSYLLIPMSDTAASRRTGADRRRPIPCSATKQRGRFSQIRFLVLLGRVGFGVNCSFEANLLAFGS